jgi:protease I
MKALMLLADGFEDVQFFCPFYRLQEEGVFVTVAGSSGQPLTGLHGYRVEPDMPIHELNPAEYDLLVIPGGQSPERLRQREVAVDVTRTFIEEGRIVAVIGHAAQLLISAGAADGRALTCAPGIRDDVRAAGGGYREDAVVVDGNVISSRGSDDLPRFCQQIVAALAART